jgi:hypothetical protein
MSIQIKKITGEPFDLPTDYSIEVEKNNPLFETKGSQTVPISFPATAVNNKLLEFPFRLDRRKRQSGTIDVVVESGIVQQRGLLSVNSAGDSLISANIGFDESEMYAKFESVKLADMADLPVVAYHSVDLIMQHLSSVMRGEIETDYRVFPVNLKVDTVEEDSSSGTFTNMYYEILNLVKTNPSAPDPVDFGDLLALTDRKIIRYESGEPIELEVPAGYGASAFLKVSKIIDLIFLNFGYTIEENPFQTHHQLRHLVVLNNCFDAVLTGNLYYKDLMPDCTIREFLDFLYAKFGLLFFVNSNQKTIKLIFLRDLLSTDIQAIDLTKYKNKSPEIAFSEPKQLRLKMNRELPGAEVIGDNTYENFLEKFAYQFSPSIETGTPFGGTVTQIFHAHISQYAIYNIFKLGEKPYLSSDFFDWDKKSKMDYEDVEMKDLCLPLSSTEGMHLLQYLVGYQHRYSDLIVGGEVTELPENPSKLAVAFSYGMSDYISPYVLRYSFASQINRDEWGKFIYRDGLKFDISLTCNHEDGLYNRFWKEYDLFLRHSNQEVSCQLHLSEMQTIDFKMYHQYCLDNQPFLMKQLKFKLNGPDTLTDALFRSLRLFEPVDPDELKIEEYSRPEYFWKFVVDYTPEPGSSYKLLSTLYPFRYYLIDGVKIPISYLSFLPPTREEYENTTTRVFQYIEIYSNGLLHSTVVVTVTYTPERIIYPG